MYQWWVFVHLIGVFGFLVAHGVSVGVLFRLRSERNPERINALLQLSGASVQGFYVSLGVLLLGGIVAGFLGHWWSQGWIWAGIGLLVLTSLAMYGMARPYYRRVRFISNALAGGSQAVSDEQYAAVLRSRRPITIAAIGFVGLAAILYFMLFKPTLGLGGTAAAAPRASAPPGGVSEVAKGVAFERTTLSAPGSTGFVVAFDNQDRGIPHNIAIYSDRSASKVLFRGAIVTGPKTVDYHVGALAPGTYFFRCDVHPTQMTGTLVVRGGASP